MVQFAAKRWVHFCRERMGTFLPWKHLSFQFKGPWALASQFSAFEKCIFHFCTIRLKPVALQVFTASYFWNPLTSDYVVQGCLFPRKKGPKFLEALNLWVRCSSFFFQKKGPPYFWKPLTCGYVGADVFFFLGNMAPICLEAPNLWVRCRRRFLFFRRYGPHMFGSP